MSDLQEFIEISGFTSVGLTDKQRAEILTAPMKQPGQNFYPHLTEANNRRSQTGSIPGTSN